ncbi:MAG: hypothetical protein R3279_08915 [Putridiphycobacter sp.]|jgi:hypothetical protein|nr:hypothetical protein [Putridiphycobacter sp.]
MKKCFKSLAKEKLSQHQHNGLQSRLSVIEVAQLFDIITGRTEQSMIENRLIIQNISLN